MHRHRYEALSNQVTSARRQVAMREYQALFSAHAALRRQEFRYDLATSWTSGPFSESEYWSAVDSGEERWRVVATEAWNQILARARAAVDCLSRDARPRRLRSGRVVPPQLLDALQLETKLTELCNQFEQPHAAWDRTIGLMRALTAEVQKVIDEFAPESARKNASQQLADLLRRQTAQLASSLGKSEPL